MLAGQYCITAFLWVTPDDGISNEMLIAIHQQANPVPTPSGDLSSSEERRNRQRVGI